MNNYPFPSWSQLGQDLFVYDLLKDQKQNECTYLEFGGQNPRKGNNTYNLELQGWKGLSFDIKKQLIPMWKKYRKNPLLIQDTTTTNWNKIFDNYSYLKSPIDYLSFDVDDATKKTLLNFPFDKIRFKIITFEHNLYIEPKLKKLSVDFFKSLGYILVCENISIRNGPLEDWWVDEKYIDKSKYGKYICKNKNRWVYFREPKNFKKLNILFKYK